MTEGTAATARRDAIDVARILALMLVVVGHLTLAVIDRPGGKVRGANLIALYPGWAWLAATAPMPVFFAAAGWANATAELRPAAARLRRLVGLAAIVVAAWSAAVILATVIAGEPGTIGDGARIATQPLWFLAAYVPFAVTGSRLSRLAVRHPVSAIGGVLGALAMLDLGRFALEAPEWIGWLAFYLAWVTPWLLGAWWRDRWARGGFPERRIGLALALAAGLMGAALVACGGYSVALIDAVPGERSNTTPPTLYTAIAGVAQVGVLLVVAVVFDRIGRRWREFWDRAGELAVGVYLWHLTALALCAGAIALGVPTPDRFTGGWWATRPVWIVSVVALTVVLVVATAALQERMAGRTGPNVPATAPAVLGVAATAAGAALVGLRGPRTAGLALACSALFAAGWCLLGAARVSTARTGATRDAP